MTGPRPTSVASRMLAFFEANPDEELTLEQAITKFGVGRPAVEMAVLRLERERRLEKVKVIRLPSKGRAS